MMNVIGIYEDLDRFDEVYGDLDLTMLHSGEKQRVFVYGTLMTGMRNHHRMDTMGIKIISDNANTGNESFEMLTRTTDAGYLAPIVIPARSEDSKYVVKGELYEMSNSALIVLDRIEGNPVVYKRERIEISIGKINKKTGEWITENAWIYMYVDKLPCPESMIGITTDSLIMNRCVTKTCQWEGV